MTYVFSKKQQGSSLVENLIASTILIGACTMAFKAILGEIFVTSTLEKKVSLEKNINYQINDFLITNILPPSIKNETNDEKVNIEKKQSFRNGLNLYIITGSNDSSSKSIDFLN